MGKQIRIGTRQSLLAVAQAKLLKQYIESRHPDIQVSLYCMKTTGDQILNKKLEEIGGKGLFVKELDLALKEGRTDLSVHSLKDMPMEEDPEYPILGYSKREDPADALVLPQDCGKLDLQLPIGSASQRRCLQLKQIYPGCKTKMIRGNVLTRLKKLDNREYGAIVLAAAGLKRLGLEHRISRRFLPTEMIPAAGQGILAVQGHKDFDVSLLAGFFDQQAKWQAWAERSFVQALDGGCSLPVAAHATALEDSRMLLAGFFGTDRNQQGYVTATVAGRNEDAHRLGVQLAQKVLALEH